MNKRIIYKSTFECNWCGAEVKWSKGYQAEDYTHTQKAIIVDDKNCEFLVDCKNCKCFNKVIVSKEELKRHTENAIKRNSYLLDNED